MHVLYLAYISQMQTTYLRCKQQASAHALAHGQVENTGCHQLPGNTHMLGLLLADWLIALTDCQLMLHVVSYVRTMRKLEFAVPETVVAAV